MSKWVDPNQIKERYCKIINFKKQDLEGLEEEMKPLKKRNQKFLFNHLYMKKLK